MSYVTGRNGVCASVIVTLVLFMASLPVSAATATCQVTNKSTGARYTQLKAAVRAAKPGQKLDIKGVCGRASIDKNLTIKGVRSPTLGRATIDANRKGAALFVAGGTTVTLRSLTVRGGDLWDGGIINRGSLTLVSVTVRDNKGGGVDNEGALHMYGTTTITGNSADYGGGGVYNEGSLYMYDSSSISGNTAKNGGGVYGAGPVTMNGSSSISDNSATDGGGIYSGSTVTLNDSASIHSNTAYANGGGVNTYITLTMTGASAIHSNTAAVGGGVYVDFVDGLVGVVCGTNVYGNSPSDCAIEYEF